MASDLAEGGRGNNRVPARLSTTALPTEKIGNQSFQAQTAIVLSRHVTYQQKTHVFGYIAPTRGLMWDGYGSTFGAGGSIASKSESVVQVVYSDFDGRDETAELPASVSARENGILRLEFMNGIIYAVQNLSGRQDMRGLLGPDTFIPKPNWSGWNTIFLILAVMCVIGHQWLGILVFGSLPAITIYRQITADRQRKELGRYMGQALSAHPLA